MVVYIGEFPSPFNGVSVKNDLLYQEFSKIQKMKILDIAECKRQPFKIPIVALKLLLYLLVAEQVIVGVGTDNRRKFIMQLRKILRGNKGLSSLVMIAMGGRLHLTTSSDKFMKKLLSKCGRIIVETKGINDGLENMGIKNCIVIPNCRSKKGDFPPVENIEITKFVYFSIVCEEKGMEDIREAIPKLVGKYSIHIYGEVVERYKNVFENFLQENPKILYKGVFDGAKDNVYRELNQYDVMLFPSHWKGEGVPGALVESKMAGITAIVSDWNFNKEVVINGIEGIVYTDSLAVEMNRLISDRSMLKSMKLAAYDSRKRYYTSTYRKLLQEVIAKDGEN